VTGVLAAGGVVFGRSFAAGVLATALVFCVVVLGGALVLLRVARRKLAANLAAAEVPPEGVRIHRADGTTVECDVLRDPDLDRPGSAFWVAVPRDDIAVSFETDRLEVDELPAGTAVGLRGHLRDEPGG
jgi:hypothetical protein